MATRTIDFAKTASIDMMTLNNKVVNMRQVVKQTKVHVISKLCRHIAALKKKKGTDEQKAKNLRKAERFIEEIDSIKKLKEDKISKYALANTASFSDTSKISLSPGPRALARLADHPLMKKVVTCFREQHSDWRDLAAYLLIKQTGRRFKTKKQKELKLAKSIENIHASETMTKAYIQQRFGHEGLTKAEQRFERKRKRPQSANSGSKERFHVGESENNNQQSPSSGSEENRIEDLQQEHLEMQISQTDTIILNNNKIPFLEDVKNKEVHKSNGRAKMVEEEGQVSGGSTENDEVQGVQSVSFQTKTILLQHSSSSEDSQAQLEEHPVSRDEAETVCKVEISDVSRNKVRARRDKTKQRSECVVKQLRLGETGSDDGSTTSGDDDSSDSSDDANDNDATTNDDDASKEDLGSSSDGNQTLYVDDDGHKSRKSQEKKKKPIPDFMIKANKSRVSDPFFAGSDDEGEGDLQDNVTAEMYNSDDNLADGDDFSSGRFRAKSMFYNPTSQESSSWSQGARGRRGGYERRGEPGRFDRGQRGRRGGNERRGGPGRFDRGQRGITFGGDRGGSLVGSSRDGSSQGLDRKFTAQQTYGSRANYSNQTTRDRFSGRNTAELASSRGHAHKGAALDNTSQDKLHPSWEASKKRKAEQSSLTAFRGSKITFDDDD